MNQREEKRFNRGNIPIYILSLMMVLSFLCIPSAVAGSSDDYSGIQNQKCSLRVNISDTGDSGSKTGVKDVPVSVYLVATLKLDGDEMYYKATNSFGGERLDFEKMSASQINDFAKKLAEMTEKEWFAGEKKSVKSNGSGVAVFNDLVQGVYLVVVEKYGSATVGYSKTDPFLVRVPDPGLSGEWITDVKVYPKSKGGNTPYITDDPPITKRVEGTNRSKEIFTFELRAENITNPMPSGSKEGKKQVTIRGSGESEFGVIKFTEPGTYSYKAYEIAGNNSNYTYDKTVYTVKYKVSRSGDVMKSEKTITDSSGKKIDKADGYLFVNKYSEPFITRITKTGDYFMQIVLITSLIVSFSVIAFIVIRRRILKGQIDEK